MFGNKLEISIFAHLLKLLRWRAIHFLQGLPWTSLKNRLHYVVTYDDQMGKGDMVDQVTNPGEWRSILPGSVGNSVKKIICN